MKLDTLYTFRNENLLSQAVTHPSFSKENYERLEFLGDSVLGSAVTRLLFDQHVDCQEGKLTQMRASLVNEKFLCTLSMDLGLDRLILADKGAEKDGVYANSSVLADVFEAVVAAIYLDSSYETVFGILSVIFKPYIANPPVFLDFKSGLQDVIQRTHRTQPTYEVQNVTGPDHKRTFTVTVSVKSLPLGKGMGYSKKEAEQDAAKNALMNLS